MPAKGVDTTALVYLLYVFFLFFKWYAVNVFVLVAFKTTKIPAIHGRVIAGNRSYIAAVFLVFPMHAVGQIVLVPKHKTGSRQCFHIAVQVYRFFGGFGIRRQI